MWEKIKDWIREHKGLSAVLAGLLVAGLYYIVRRSKGGQGSESYSPAMMAYSPGDGGSSGGGSSGGGGSDIAGLAGLIQQGQKDQLEQQRNFFDVMTGYLTNLAATMPQVPTPLQSPEQAPMAATIFQAPVTRIAGGSGGGMVYTETIEQIEEFASGGSRNMGGNYSLNFKDWEPEPGSNQKANTAVSAVTKKTGTIEQQLSGMSQNEKMAALKKAGLV